MTIRIVIASNSAEFRQNIKSALESSPDLEVCGVAAALDELPTILHELKPDLVLLESSVVKSEEPIEPHAVQFQGHEVKIVVIRQLEDEDLEILEFADETIKVNKLDILDTLADKLLLLVRKEIINYKIENENRNREKSNEFLTKREFEVLKLVGDGKTNHEIAMILVISERTVDFHLCNILQKLDSSNRTQAVIEANKRGIIKL